MHVTFVYNILFELNYMYNIVLVKISLSYPNYNKWDQITLNKKIW